MFHELLKIWFNWVDQWGYVGVFVLMALESSIVPVPSEIVMPPAAFWAAQGKMSFWGVVLAGTAGSYFGSAVNYFFFRWAGSPILERYGKYVLMPPSKVRMAEDWVTRFGTFGIFIARLLPVVRHLISIPAGILRMPFAPFSVATLVGAGLWCAVLSWFGQEVLGRHPELLHSPAEMVAAMKNQLHWFVAAVVGMAMSYAVVLWFKRPRHAKI